MSGCLIVSRPCYVPDELRAGVFPLAKARALGLSKDDLRGSAWRRVAHGWYRWRGCPPREEHLLTAIAATLPAGGAFSGLTAARLLGIEAPIPKRPEVVVPDSTHIANRAPATVRCIRLDPPDVVLARGFPVTSPARTCFDLAGRLPLTEAVAAIDMALHDHRVSLGALEAYVAAHRGVHGVVKARRVLPLLEPKSESPMESRLRMLLVLNHLDRPQAQVSLCDAAGRFVARVDLYYAAARLAIEYDGEQHRDQLTADNRRQNRLHDIGVSLLRYTAPDVKESPDQIVAQVAAALRRAPEPRFHAKRASCRAP